MEIRSLRAGEQDACLDLWDSAFENTPRGFFEKYFKDPSWKPDDTIVCVDSESQKLISAVHFVRRTVETKNGRRNFAGIANVGTDPEFRGLGCSKACLLEAHARIDADPWFDFGLLGTGIFEFYARLGWQRWEFHGWQGVYQHATTDFLIYDFLQPATIDDLPKIRAIYDAHTKNQPLSVVRDEAYWKRWLKLDKKPGRLLEGWQVSSDSYVHFRITPNTVDILEVGGKPALHDLLCARAQINLLYPCSKSEAEALLLEPTEYPVSHWMVRQVANKPLPDLTEAYFLETDGF
jgi:GNAT superfamily N-acetyltransferase